MTECHLSVLSQQTTTATNQASVMHAVIHAWYMSGLISGSVYIAIADSGPLGPRYIGALLYIDKMQNVLLFQSHSCTFYTLPYNSEGGIMVSCWPPVCLSYVRLCCLDGWGAHLTGDMEVAGSTPTGSATFFCGY